MKLGQGYVFTGMCDSVHREGVCLSAWWDATHTPLGADTPLGSRHPSPQRQTPPRSRHPPGADPPEADTPPGAEPPRSRHPPEEDTPGEADTASPWEADTPQEQTPSLEADTPWEANTPPKQTPPGSRHPPERQTPPEADPPGSRHPLGSRYPPEADNPPTPTQEADTPQKADTTPQSILGDTVNVRAVCILLECNLVWPNFWRKLHGKWKKIRLRGRYEGRAPLDPPLYWCSTSIFELKYHNKANHPNCFAFIYFSTSLLR